MTTKELLSSKWARVVVFLWLIVFPLVFIIGPFVEMMMEEGTEQSWTPVWALIVWMLGPWVASIVMKYAGGTTTQTEEEN